MQKKQHKDVYPSENNEMHFLPQSLENASATLAGDNSEGYPDQFQTWLGLPTVRAQRQYLENHYDVLDEQSEQPLRGLLAQAPEGSEQAQRMRGAFSLLQDARRRGGTVEAVREAYINLYGGFALDLPSWLESVEQRLAELLKEKSLEPTAEARVELLQEALERVQEDTTFSLELLATLYRELADARAMYPRTDRTQTLETAISIYEEILLIYTKNNYPYQYALTQRHLGRAYFLRIAGERWKNLEQALACYDEALHVCVLNTFPFEYAEAQNGLGNVYDERIVGGQRENLEQAISCFCEALRVYTLDTYPFEYARVRNNLGNAYLHRVAGERRENLEQAIICYHEALRVGTLDAYPFYYALTQNNIGGAYKDRIAGDRQENLERAIAYYHEVLRIYTVETFPLYYAGTQHNLGEVYKIRTVGEHRENLEQAIAYFHEALRFWTLHTYPFYYAETQHKLGDTYRERLAGERQENLEQAVLCYCEALHVYTLDAFPRESRNVHLSLAETEAQCGNWSAVQEAYTSALEAEDLLVILGAGTQGRDAILKEGREAATRLGYALHRLGRASEAAIAMERGRARGLAEAMAFNAADPALIVDEERRSRYREVREALIATQAELHAPFPPDLDEDNRRRLDLTRIAGYRQARTAFDALVTEIRAAHDPDDFLDTSLEANTLLRAAERIGPGHALVYLAATPWGGTAVAALSAEGSSEAHFVTLDLPDLTETWVNALSEMRLDDGSERYVGGFVLAQMSEGFEQVREQWDGETFYAKAMALHAACEQTRQESTLDRAAQEALSISPLAELTTSLLASLSRDDLSLLSATFNQLFLQHELDRCQEQLGTMVMQPLLSWLREQRAASLTIIPCGHLATFPLATVVLPDGHSVSETLPTSVAPSARALLHSTPTRNIQAGVAALGDPEGNLPWSKAEALTFAALARRFALPAAVHVSQQATREQLIAALGSRWAVDASCHGTFDARNFLQSALRLARKERIHMAEMLSHQIDLRGLRLLLLSACQTALLDLQGARDEMHSLAAAMLQAGAQAVLAAHWAVDDQATYLLMIRFAQEWLPQRETEPPAAALARAQAWLRTVTNAHLAVWRRAMPISPRQQPHEGVSLSRDRQAGQTTSHQAEKQETQWQRVSVRGQPTRYLEEEAQLVVRLRAEEEDPEVCPFADPYYWAAFQVIGW